MYLVIDDMDNKKTFNSLDGVCKYIKDKLGEIFSLTCEFEAEKNFYLALIDKFFIYDMQPELTPFFDVYNCYLSDLFSIYKQLM